MRGDYFSFARSHKTIVVGNHQPKLNAVTPAIRRRVQMVPFNAVFASVAALRRYLETLAARFAAVDVTGLVLEEIVERAAAALLPDVVKYTVVEENWYAEFVAVVAFAPPALHGGDQLAHPGLGMTEGALEGAVALDPGGVVG